MKKVIENLFRRTEKSLIGLDVGTISVKAVELAGSDGAYTIKSAAKVDVDLDGDNGTDNTVRAIGKCVQECGFSSNFVVCAVNATEAAVRNFELDPMPLEEANYAVLVEAEHVSPTDMDKTIVDFQFFTPFSEWEKLKGVIVAAKAEAVREKCRIVQCASLLPVLMDVDTLALINCFSEFDKGESSKNKAIVQVNNECTNLAIMGNDPVPFIRSVSARGGEILNVLAGYSNINVTQAKKEILGGEQAFLNHTIFKNFEFIMNDIVGKVSDTLSYYSRQGNGPVDKISLCGDFACIDTVREMFIERLGIEVDLWNPLGGLETSVPVRKLVEQHGSAMAVAAGLALRAENIEY